VLNTLAGQNGVVRGKELIIKIEPQPQSPPPSKKKDRKFLVIALVVITILVMVSIISVVLYLMVIWVGISPITIPDGQWGPPEVHSPTEVDIPFARMDDRTRPVQLEIVLVRNLTDQGIYNFYNNDDGQLTHTSGTDVGTLTYEDLEDDRRVNPGDRIEMTELSPASDYTIIMIWAPTGDMITSGDFSTPAG
jgi:hypothetical protein